MCIFLLSDSDCVVGNIKEYICVLKRGYQKIGLGKIAEHDEMISGGNPKACTLCFLFDSACCFLSAMSNVDFCFA